MHSLIAAVIAIILIAIAAIATLWVGGGAYLSSSQQAIYAKAVNGGLQIEAALNLYLAKHGSYPKGTSDDILATLVEGGYLNAIPEGNWEIGEELIVRPIMEADQCLIINRLAGKNVSLVNDPDPGCPSCDDPLFKDFPACQSED